jgi:hypothetical protein
VLVQVLNIQADLSPDKLQPCRRFANDTNQEEEKRNEKRKAKVLEKYRKNERKKERN